MSRRKYLAVGAGVVGAAVVGGAAYYLSTRGPTTPSTGKPLEGETVKILSFAAPYTNWVKNLGPKFKEEYGAELVAVECPDEELYRKAVTEFIAGTGAYDVVVCHYSDVGEFVVNGWIECIEDLYNTYGLDPHNEDMSDVLRLCGCGWGGKVWGQLQDGDIHIFYYRKDLFNHPDERDEFKSQYGFELRPPQTWEEHNKIAEFFTRKKGEKLAGQTLEKDFYGTAFWGKRGFAFGWFVGRWAGFELPYFDEEMNPMIDSEEGIKAMENLVEAVKYCPPGVLNYQYADIRAALANGDIAMCEQWTCVGKGPEFHTPDMIPKIGYSILPGWMVNGQLKRRAPLLVGHLLVVPKDSKHKKAATYAAWWFTKPGDIDFEITSEQKYTTLCDPWRKSTLDSSEFAALWPTAAEYLAAIKASFESAYPELRIPGGHRYLYDEVDQAVVDACSGVKDPEKAIKDCAKAWDQITDEYGREKQKQYWKQELENWKRAGIYK